MERSDKTEISNAVKAKLTLSIFWTFVLFNYIYADFFKVMALGSVHLPKEYMLAAAVVMEIPIAMVLLSWLLPHGLNRWANIVTGAIMTAVIIFTLVGTVGEPGMAFYVFFQVIEIVSTSAIVWIAFTWRNPQKTVRAG